MTVTPVLEARRLVKRFGAVEALRGADFTVYPKEVVALVGDNGAGKSTLVKILSGALEADGGEIAASGKAVRIASPIDARRLGIETVYQDLALAPELTPDANLFLGRERLRGNVLGKFGFLDKRSMRAATTDAFQDLGVRVVDIATPVSRLSGGQRQGVAVARSVVWASRVVFMDEPTAALGVVQTRQVLDLIRRVRDSGKSVVLISHNLP
jgi:simple sugar transport system ATP-binding protein